MRVLSDPGGDVLGASMEPDICPCCGSQMRAFFEIPQVPVNSCILIDSRDKACNYPRGDIQLGFCDNCGFICNLAFDPMLTEYSGRYEETQGFSPTFRQFHEELAADLIERYDLQAKDILEIGCGKGEFLALLCKKGRNRGVGFDPGYDEERGVLAGLADIRVIKDFYSAAYSGERADLVCCKMTLEHIQHTADFVRMGRQAMRPNETSVLYLQVPESTRILADCAFEDIYYEHCSYFTPGSLARLCRAEGLDVHRLRIEYGGQYLAVDAMLAANKPSYAGPGEDDLPRVREYVDTFAERCALRIGEWRTRLQDEALRGPVVLWGSGSKAVAFLGAVDHENHVERVVDINPHRQGHYMPGTGQPIVSPESLLDIAPSCVIVMNAIYVDEISAVLVDLGLNTNVISL